VIIFSRWGFFVLLFGAAGSLLGLGIQALVTGSVEPGRFVFFGLGEMIAAAGLWFFSRAVIDRHLDKPKPITITERLAQPYVHPNGAVQHFQTIPLLHPQTGQQMWTQPRSTFFFMPVIYWAYLIGAVGLTVFIGSLISSLF